MPSPKRRHDGTTKPSTPSAPPSQFTPMFETFRAELDEHHDRRERVIKASRDITALSKKIIFSLQRVKKLQTLLSPNISNEISTRQGEIAELFTSIVPDLGGINAWRYQRNISGGIQEFMEAISFQQYLETQTLVTFEEAQDKLPLGVELTQEDYIGGLYDLGGELMRFAITGMAIGGEVPRGSGETCATDDRDILNDLRDLRARFEVLDTERSGLRVEKKMDVLKTCVEKVEGAVYGMTVRGRERPTGWTPGLGEEGGGPDAVESY